MATDIPEMYPTLSVLDPPDWTTEDIARHLRRDVVALDDTLLNAIRNNKTDKLLAYIENFHGRVRSWLRLYASVTQQKLSRINM